MIELRWKEMHSLGAKWLEAEGLPLWREAGLYPQGVPIGITIERRPSY